MHRHELLSIVIPAFNEEKRIEKTIETIAAYMRARRGRYEIVVSDDGSADATRDIVTTLQQKAFPIGLVGSDRNRGKGSAVRQGVMASAGDLVLVTDADLATPIEELEALTERIRAGADIAIGSRGLRASRLIVRQPFYREFMGRLFNLLVRLTMLPGVSDTQCGFKVFRGPVARKLFAYATVDGFAFDVEVLALAARAAYRVEEVPVRWAHMNHSKMRLGSDGLNMFQDMIRVAYRLRTGWYDLAALAASTGEAQRAVASEKT